VIGEGSKVAYSVHVYEQHKESATYQNDNPTA